MLFYERNLLTVGIIKTKWLTFVKNDLENFLELLPDRTGKYNGGRFGITNIWPLLCTVNLTWYQVVEVSSGNQIVAGRIYFLFSI
jgi:uncharacterized protein with NRDE domain